MNKNTGNLICYRETRSSKMYIIDQHNMTEELWVYRQNGPNALQGIDGGWEFVGNRDITTEEIMDTYRKLITSYDIEHTYPEIIEDEIDARCAEWEAQTAEHLAQLNLRLRMEELATGE